MNSDLASEKRISEKIKKKFNQDVIIQKQKRIWMTIEKKDELLECAKWLKDEGFVHLSAISVSDWLKEKKFKLDYILWSFEEKVIFILTIKIDRDNPVIDSVISIWGNNAQAHEREAWELVHAEAIEELMGLEIPERAKYIRVIMAELSRIQSHLAWWGVFSIATGFDTGFKIAFGYRDYILDLFAEITGGRVYPAGYICPGGLRRDFPKGMEDKIDKVLEKIQESIRYIEVGNPTFFARTRGIGILKLEDAINLGATGPVLRASGLKYDLRRDDPYEVYNKFDFKIPVREKGDIYARLMIGLEEIKESIKIIKQVLITLSEGELILSKFERPKLKTKIQEGEVYVYNEIARGEGGMHVFSDGGIMPYRIKIRGPSFSHMIPVLEFLLQGADIADIPAIYWSLNVCPSDMDR